MSWTLLLVPVQELWFAFTTEDKTKDDVAERPKDGGEPTAAAAALPMVFDGPVSFAKSHLGGGVSNT